MRHIAHDRWRRWPRSQWVHYCDPDCFVVTRMGKVDGVRTCERALFWASALMLSVKAICPVRMNVPTPVPTANVTSTTPVEMDY